MAAAIRVHPGGCLLAIMCALMIPWCWISAATGRMWRIREPGRVVLVCLLLVAGASLLQWLVRYAIVRGWKDHSPEPELLRLDCS